MSTPLIPDCPKLKVGPLRSPKYPILIVLRSGWFVFSVVLREQENASASITSTTGRIIFCKWRLVCCCRGEFGIDGSVLISSLRSSASLRFIRFAVRLPQSRRGSRRYAENASKLRHH